MSCLQSKSSVSPSSSPAARAAAACASRALDGVSFTSRAASAWPCWARTARASRRSCASLSTLLHPRRRAARACSATTSLREERAVRRLVNRVSVEASFFKRLSAAENLSYAARFYGLTPAHTRARIPEILAAVGFPARARRGADGGPLARDAAEGRARARAADLADAAAARRADDRPRPALQARGAGLHPARCARTHDTTTLLCTHDMAEAEALADRVGILDRRAPARARAPRGAAPPLRRARRSRTRSSPRPAARSRTTRTTTTRRPRDAHRDRRRVRCQAIALHGRGRAQRLPGQALRLVGARVLRLDGRQHADDRLHRQGRRGDRRARSTSSARRRAC